jgi:hypothetical protein
MTRKALTAQSFSKSHAPAEPARSAVIGPDAIIAAARHLRALRLQRARRQPACSHALDAARGWTKPARVRRSARSRCHCAPIGGHRFSIAEGGVYHFCDFSGNNDRPVSALLSARSRTA